MSLTACFDELPLVPHPICLLSLPRFALRLVSHLVGRLVAIVLPSMCFSCVFFTSFS